MPQTKDQKKKIVDELKELLSEQKAVILVGISGLKVKELAELMLFLGATEAMAFDGGRSVSMFAAGKEVVKGHREMADALGVFQINP